MHGDNLLKGGALDVTRIRRHREFALVYLLSFRPRGVLQQRRTSPTKEVNAGLQVCIPSTTLATPWSPSAMARLRLYADL